MLLAYGATIRDRGTGSTPSAGRPMYSMSCELALVAGRPCDLPGRAESADP